MPQHPPSPPKTQAPPEAADPREALRRLQEENRRLLQLVETQALALQAHRRFSLGQDWV